MMSQLMKPSTTQSKLGVASFVIGVSTFAVALLWYALLIILPTNSTSGSGNPLFIYYILFLFFVAPVAHLVGEILGIISLFIKDRRKLFAILGILTNLPFLIFWILAYSLLYHWYKQGWFR
jgi:hypothetical protein